MSRAFVKESDDTGEPLPELSVSPHPNFVTPTGLTQIDARVTSLEADLRSAKRGDDKALVARIQRDLRYWTQRRVSARLVAPQACEPEAVRFGVAVTVRFADGTQRTFKVVGEDEADPARGLVSWVSPLGCALRGRAIGDEVAVTRRPAAIVALSR